MGSYCELYVADYPVFSSKSHVIPEVMTLFRESDKNVCIRTRSDRNRLVWGDVHSGDDGDETVVEYRVRTEHAIERLGVMGFTLDRVKREFERGQAAEIHKFKEWDDEFWLDTIDLLETSAFQDYLDAFQTILTSGVPTFRFAESFPDAPPLIGHIVHEYGDFAWGLPCSDIRCLLRALLEVSPRESYVTQDITEVVDAGYYTVEDTVCDQALAELTCGYPTNSKIIILTEGTTDTEVLEPSLRLLYPHLCDYYSFMDFGMRPPGGAGSMINVVKAFAGAGIENKVVVLLDNDTAAFSAMDALAHIPIPSNIVISRYPDVELARRYPTLGPSGLVPLDINGLACSIELYLGSDVLETDGSVEPVQWKGYDERMRRYQGEIMHKAGLKDRFLEKLRRCQSDPSAIDTTDWDGIRTILLHIFDAFNSQS